MVRASPPVCKPDPCLTGGALKANACAEEGESCVRDILVVCERDSAGCPIAERTDCTDDGGNNACRQDGDEAECVEDPCVGADDLCEDEGLSCRDGLLVSCAERGTDDCLLERVTDCTAEPGGPFLDEDCN